MTAGEHPSDKNEKRFGVQWPLCREQSSLASRDFIYQRRRLTGTRRHIALYSAAIKRGKMAAGAAHFYGGVGGLDNADFRSSMGNVFFRFH